ncbi:cupredoxin domain-containing protein [Algibacillus agarilyticus]|uniref:cupredoxin domain-containing protein n=1 Tax=Algibacillus agarilyticus TaxID=2234133 RepID=UPI000DCFBA47|nr:cupredoxin domain-containing protein [Algibacillus agarilyticus]
MMIVNILGVALIALIVWWFWLYKPVRTVVDKSEIIIEVNGGVYSPASIQVPANQPFSLKFLREDQSPCSETLLIPSLDVSEQLKLGEITQINFTNLTPGEYVFHCQMQMYRGVLLVVEENKS